MNTRFLSLAAAMLLTMCHGAAAQDIRAGESGNAVPPAIFMSAEDHQGPVEAEELTLGMWVKAGNVTTYTIGNSWND
ncbi:hypothetical protein [Psychromarinibacter sp. S121]|uniref:hypothetical protein n=1 Tax=Psychromarinibacter sp. S121 TaxID=3415127 RepID=UPI003C79CD22